MTVMMTGVERRVLPHLVCGTSLVSCSGNLVFIWQEATQMGAGKATELVSPLVAERVGTLPVFTEFAEAESIVTFGEADSDFVHHQWTMEKFRRA
jgi:hypothetical protein